MAKLLLPRAQERRHSRKPSISKDIPRETITASRRILAHEWEAFVQPESGIYFYIEDYGRARTDLNKLFEKLNKAREEQKKKREDAGDISTLSANTSPRPLFCDSTDCVFDIYVYLGVF